MRDVKFERKYDGVIIVDGMEIAHTMQCCHCNRHFVSVKGSGKIRGFCRNCMKITCGKPQCDICVPFEKKLEKYEAGKIKML